MDRRRFSCLTAAVFRMLLGGSLSHMGSSGVVTSSRTRSTSISTSWRRWLLGARLAIVRLCIASGRWHLLCQFSLVLFVATLASLLVATRIFTVEYGLGVERIWWLPDPALHWLFGR